MHPKPEGVKAVKEIAPINFKDKLPEPAKPEKAKEPAKSATNPQAETLRRELWEISTEDRLKASREANSKPDFDFGQEITYVDEKGKKRSGLVLSKRGDWKHGLLVERKGWFGGTVKEFIKKDWIDQPTEAAAKSAEPKKSWWNFFGKKSGVETIKPKQKIVATGFDSNMSQVDIEIKPSREKGPAEIGDVLRVKTREESDPLALWKVVGTTPEGLITMEQNGQKRLISQKDLARYERVKTAKVKTTTAKETREAIRPKPVQEDEREQAKEISLDDIKNFEQETYGQVPKIPKEEEVARFVPGKDFDFYTRTEQADQAKEEAGIEEGKITIDQVRAKLNERKQPKPPTPETTASTKFDRKVYIKTREEISEKLNDEIEKIKDLLMKEDPEAKLAELRVIHPELPNDLTPDEASALISIIFKKVNGEAMLLAKEILKADDPGITDEELSINHPNKVVPDWTGELRNIRRKKTRK